MSGLLNTLKQTRGTEHTFWHANSWERGLASILDLFIVDAMGGITTVKALYYGAYSPIELPFEPEFKALLTLA